MIYRPEIDGLRALSVLAVALFHIDFPFFGGGFSGVDVFFVISGYLITSMIENEIALGKFSLVDFWERRIRRILPALTVVIVFVLIFGAIFMVPNHFLDLGQSVGSQGVFLTNYMFWRETGYFDNPAQFKPLLHTWSLSVEEQFYIVIPLVFFFFSKFRASIRKFIVIAGLLISFFSSLYYVENHQNAVFYFLPFRAWELLFGSFLALNVIRVKSSNRWVSEVLGTTGILIIISCFIFYDDRTVFSGLWALPVCLGASLFIWGTSLNNRTSIIKLFGNRVVTLIGKISYSFYLIHWPVLLFGTYLILRPLKFYESIGLILISFGLSYLSWKYIEQPVRLRKILIPRSFVLSGGIVTLILFLGIGTLIHVNNGFPNRFNDEVNKYAEGNTDDNPRRIECHYKSIDEISKGNLCQTKSNKLGNSERSTFISWGDSHADAMMPVLEKISIENDLLMFHASMNGCPPVLNVGRIDWSSQHNDECVSFNESMLQAVEQKDVGHVILIARWIVYTEGRSDIESSTLREPLLYDLGDRGSVSNESSRKILEKQLTETVEQIVNLGADVWIIEQPPEQNIISPPNQLAQYAIRGKDVSTLGVNFDLHKQREGSVTKLINNVARNYPEVHVISPDIVLCNGSGICPLARDGISIYRDDDHLTVKGSMFLTSLFNEFVSMTLQN